MQPIIGHYIMFPNSYKRFKKAYCACLHGMQITYTLTLKGKPCIIIISFLYFILAVLVANY